MRSGPGPSGGYADTADEIEIPQPQDAKGMTGEDEDDQIGAAETDLGYILDEEKEEKVAKHIHKLIEDQEPAMSRNRATWKRTAWWREGKRWVKLDKKENQSIWEAKLPPGMGNAPPVPNKTDRLCRRTVNVIMVDPPYPDCEPGDDSNEARDSAEFSTRYLSVRGSPTELNMTHLCRKAAGKAMTYASSFGWVIMDPTAGGKKPREINAHPAAETADDPFTDASQLPPAQGSPDEMTKRYVKSDNTLTDDPSEADEQWLPNHRVRILTGNNVLFLPATAESVRDAEGMIIIDHTTLGDLRQQFPEKFDKESPEALKPEELQSLCEWKPRKWKDILPPYSAEPIEQKNEDGTWMDAQTVFTITIYYREGSSYRKGAYAIIGGEKLVLHRQTWTAMMAQPEDEDGQPQPDKEEVLRIPIAQCRCLDDDNYDNPYGIGMGEKLGPGDEVRASSLGYELEYMYRFGNPQAYLPMGTIVQPKQLLLRDGNPIFFNPAGKPEYEPVPPLPPIIHELREEMGQEMNDESGLQESGQGVESSDVHSGVHARTIVQEALKAISNIKDNIETFYIDLNTIILEQSKAFCSVPTMLSYVGKDGAYKEKEWDRTNFRNTKKVSVARGSFTMHTLIAKQEMANDMKANGTIDAEDYNELVAGGVSPILGNQENPDLMRVRRQLDVFDQGPTPEWTQAYEAFTAAQQQQAAQQAQEAQMAETNATLGLAPAPPAPVAPLPPPPVGPFDRDLPIDHEPSAAKIRHRAIKRYMAGSKYEAFAPEWCALLEKVYQVAANDAGIMTVQQVQKAQAAEALEASIPKPSITMKADASTVAGDIEAAAAGHKAAAAGTTPDVGAAQGAASANPQQGATIHQHFYGHAPPPPGAPPPDIPGMSPTTALATPPAGGP